MKKLEILKIPNPILHRIAKPLVFPLSESDKANINNLKQAFR